MYILIFSGQACESTLLQTVLLFFFYFPSACVLMLISFWPACNWQLCLVHVNSFYICNYCLQGKTVTKEISVIEKHAHVAVGLQLLEMSSITTLNQTILNVCTRYIFQRVLFLGKIMVILPICDKEKNSVW